MIKSTDCQPYGRKARSAKPTRTNTGGGDPLRDIPEFDTDNIGHLRQAGSGDLHPHGVDAAFSAATHTIWMGIWCGYQEQRASILAAQHAGKAALFGLNTMGDLAALKNPQSRISYGVSEPDPAFRVVTAAVRGSAGNFGPHSPIE